MSVLTHIALGFGIAVLTSIPFGTINMLVADTAINKNQRAAIWVGLGASIVQIIQSAAALKFSILLNKDPFVNRIFIIVSIPILLILGLYFWFKKPKDTQVKPSVSENMKGLGKGALISSLNMVNVPFFIFLGGYLGPSDWFHLENFYIVLFALGTALGSFLIFVLYAKLGEWIKKRHKEKSENAGKFVGVLLFGIAIWQAIRLLRIYL